MLITEISRLEKRTVDNFFDFVQKQQLSTRDRPKQRQSTAFRQIMKEFSTAPQKDESLLNKNFLKVTSINKEEKHLLESVMDSKKKSKNLLDKEDDLIVARYAEETPWGLSISVDLYDCDLEIMKNEKKIREFAQTLVKRLDMKAFGDTHVVNFGEDPRVAGFSMFQLIETSAIAGHFANASKAIYLDIFSCKAFRPHEAAAFCKSFFKAKEMNMHIAFRH